jgi:hypothetical protein
MSRNLHTLLLWLLIAVLPIQGVAAVIKASCGAERHDSVAAARMQSQDGNAMSHHHDASVVDHHHHDDLSTLAAVAAATSDESASTDTGHHHKSSTCSACAACCFGAVAPPPALSWAPDQDSYLATASPLAIQFIGHIPAGIERPPRIFSA